MWIVLCAQEFNLGGSFRVRKKRKLSVFVRLHDHNCVMSPFPLLVSLTVLVENFSSSFLDHMSSLQGMFSYSNLEMDRVNWMDRVDCYVRVPLAVEWDTVNC